MKCENTGRLIIDKLAGELSPRQAGKLDKHLAACAACRKEFEQLNEVWQLSGETLKEDSFARELTPARRAGIFGAAHNEEKRRTPKYLIRILEYAAVIIICFVFAGMLLPALNQAREKSGYTSALATKKQLEPEERIKRMDAEASEERKYDKDDFSDAVESKPAAEKSYFRRISKKRKSRGYRVYGNVPTSTGAPKREGAYSLSVSAVERAKIEDKKVSADIAAPAELKLSREVASGRMWVSGKVQKMRRAEIKQDMNYDADVSALRGAPVSRLVKTVSVKEASNKRVKLQYERFKKLPALPLKTFKLNLKLWNMTTAANVRKYLKAHNYPVPASIRVHKTRNTIIVRAPNAILKKIEKLFKKLQQEEKELKDLRKGLPFIKCSSRPVSTFSIDTDTASYVQARKCISRGERPDPLKIRPEEFINYFDYNYRSPHNSTFAVYPEAAPSPFRPNNILFRIGIQGKRLGPGADTRTHYTILLDTSGSMAVKDRMELARKALAMLLKKLKPSDYVSLLLCGGRTPGYHHADRSRPQPRNFQYCYRARRRRR